MCYPSMLVPSTTPLSTQMQSVAQSNNYSKSQAWVILQHALNPSPGCSRESRAASPSPTVTAEAGAAVAAAAAAVVGCVTPTHRAWCRGSPSCSISSTPPDSTSTRPGMSASSSLTSASSSGCSNRMQKRSVERGRGDLSAWAAM